MANVNQPRTGNALLRLARAALTLLLLVCAAQVLIAGQKTDVGQKPADGQKAPAGQKANDPPKKEDAKDLVTTLKIIVTGGKNDKPIDNASVYIRYDEPRFLRRSSEIELDLKTDMKGITKIKGVPRKQIMIQVVKSGWKPFGQYYTLDKDEQTIHIKLLPPPNWY